MTECQSNLNPFLVKSSLASFTSYKKENQQDWYKKSYKDATTKERTWKPRDNKFSCENFLYLYLFITTHWHIHNLQNIKIGLVGRG